MVARGARVKKVWSKTITSKERKALSLYIVETKEKKRKALPLKKGFRHWRLMGRLYVSQRQRESEKEEGSMREATNHVPWSGLLENSLFPSFKGEEGNPQTKREKLGTSLQSASIMNGQPAFYRLPEEILTRFVDDLEHCRPFR